MGNRGDLTELICDDAGNAQLEEQVCEGDGVDLGIAMTEEIHVTRRTYRPGNALDVIHVKRGVTDVDRFLG